MKYVYSVRLYHGKNLCSSFSCYDDIAFPLYYERPILYATIVDRTGSAMKYVYSVRVANRESRISRSGEADISQAPQIHILWGIYFEKLQYFYR